MLKASARPSGRHLLAVATIAVVAVVQLGLATAPNALAQDPGTEAKDPAVSYAQHRYGLSEQEAQRRLQLQPRVSKLDQSLRRSLRATYSGIWIDQDNGAEVVVAVTRADGSAKREADAHGLGSEVVEREVRYTEGTLLNLQERLLPVGRRDPDRVRVGGLMTDRNALFVALDAESPTPQEVAEIEESHPGALFVHRGEVAPVREEACSYPYCDPPLRGGVAMAKGTAGCTTGFAVRSRSDSKPYILTAGHCIKDTAGSTASWYTRFADNSPHNIGPNHKYVYGSTGDSGILSITNPSGWNPTRNIANWGCCLNGFITGTNHNYGILGTSGSTVGMMLCYSGGTSGTGCGKVTQLGYTTPNGVGGLGVFDADTPCEGPGDSGGPVFANNYAYGIVHGSTSIISGECQKLYQGITDALDDMNVNLY